MDNHSASRSWWPRQPLNDGPVYSRPATAAMRHLWVDASSLNGQRAGASGQQEPTGPSGGLWSRKRHRSNGGNADGNVDTVEGEAAYSIHLSPGDTSDSTQLTQLLEHLGAPVQGSQHPVQDTATSPRAGPFLSSACTLPACALPEDTNNEDLPLISNRIAHHAAMVAQTGVSAAHTSNGRATSSAHPGILEACTTAAGPMHLVSGLAGLSLGTGPAHFTPHPSWAFQASCVMYVAVFLTPESREVLLGIVPPKHPCISADHMTLAYKPSILQVLEYPLDVEVELRILGHATDSRAQAVVADPPTWLPPTTSVSTHITISVAVGTKAAEAGQLVMDALQRTAVTDPSSPSPTGAGAYVPLDEPLPLVGRLGVMLKSNGNSTSDNGDSIVIYHIEELDRGGYVSIGTENSRLYHKKHESLFCKQVQPGLTSPSTTPLSMTDGSSTQGPLLRSTPLVLPPAVMAASSGPGPFTTHTSIGQGSNALSTSNVRNQAIAESIGRCIHPRVSLLDASNSNNNDSSSGSSSDVIQFKSALDIGDYVAVRPFVPTADGGQVQQGYVKEFANDEPFQADGVLVVLTDNTIGFVTALLDPAIVVGAQRTHGHVEGSKRRGRQQQPLIEAPGDTTRQVTGEVALCNDQLSEWALSAREASAVAGSAGFSGQIIESAQQDLQLLKEFEALEQQYGQGVCNAILNDCSLDFREAIAAIRAQAAACDSGAATTSAVHDNAAVTLTALASAVARREVDEDLAQQLALSLGLDGDSALSLCKLAPMASAEGVVEALYQHGGDVQKAADALLSGASSSTAGACDSTTADLPASSSTRHAAQAALGSKDGNLVLGALQLCKQFPHLSQDTAEILLLEHGGDVDQVAGHVSEMQASELRSRTAAAADASFAASVGQSSSAVPLQSQHVASEEDQMAMLVALGVLPETQHQYATVARKPPASKPQHVRPPSPPAPGPSPAAPAPSPLQQSSSSLPRKQSTIAVRSTSARGYTHLDTHSVGQSLQRRSQSASSGTLSGQPIERDLEDPAQRRAKEQARAEADRLFTKSKKLIVAHKIYMEAAQACLKAGNEKGWEEKRESSIKALKEGRAAYHEANSISMTANNQKVQTWSCDLHGMGTTKALAWVAEQLENLRAMASPGGVEFTIITGKGKHSDDNVGKIKLNVLKYLEEEARQARSGTGRPWFKYRVDPNNDGCVIVEILGKAQL